MKDTIFPSVMIFGLEIYEHVKQNQFEKFCNSMKNRTELLHNHIFQIDQILFYDEMSGFLTQENQEV